MKEGNWDAFRQFIADMKNGDLATVKIEGDDLGVYGVKWDGLREILSSGRMVATICLSDRPGNAFFQRYLELTYFHPEGNDHELMSLVFMRWGDLLWNIVIVPIAYKDQNDQPRYGEDLFNEAAKVARMRLVQHGLPAMAGGGLVVMDHTSKPAADLTAAGIGFISPNLPERYMFMMENADGHLVYKDAQAAARQQDEDIAKLEAEKL